MGLSAEGERQVSLVLLSQELCLGPRAESSQAQGLLRLSAMAFSRLRLLRSPLSPLARAQLLPSQRLERPAMVSPFERLKRFLRTLFLTDPRLQAPHSQLHFEQPLLLLTRLSPVRPLRLERVPLQRLRLLLLRRLSLS